MPYTFTVLTPTYNRAYTLPRTYEGLKAQTFRDFEWLIVDDGSTDETAKLVSAWQQENEIPIRYLHQPNGGKAVALNRGIKELCGEFCAILDSDDYFLPETLERYLFHWHSIPEEQRGHFAGVTALCTDPGGQLIGTKFPKDVFDSNTIESKIVYGVRGDKKGMLRSDVLREFPFPTFPGERFVPPSLVWHRIAMKYQIRYVNEVLVIMEYQQDGLTASIKSNLSHSPQAASLYYRELLSAPLPLPLRARVKRVAGYVRYSLHAKRGMARIYRDAPASSRPMLLLTGWPLGLALYALDKYGQR